jgi:hypothetical protein
MSQPAMALSHGKTGFGLLLQEALTRNTAPPSSPPKKQKLPKASGLVLVVNNKTPAKVKATHVLFRKEKPTATFESIVELLYRPTRDLTKSERQAALRALLRLIGSGSLGLKLRTQAAAILDDANEFGDINPKLKAAVEAAYAAVPSKRR